MHRFLCWQFAYEMKCPLDKQPRTVRFETSALRGHPLEVIACSAVPPGGQLTCGHACRVMLENGQYWYRPELRSVA